MTDSNAKPKAGDTCFFRASRNGGTEAATVENVLHTWFSFRTADRLGWARFDAKDPNGSKAWLTGTRRPTPAEVSYGPHGFVLFDVESYERNQRYEELQHLANHLLLRASRQPDWLTDDDVARLTAHLNQIREAKLTLEGNLVMQPLNTPK